MLGDNDILAFFGFGAFFGFLWDVGIALSLSAGAAWLGQILSGGPLRETAVPGFSNYPMGNSEKGIPIPKVYGTYRLAGNILWMGPATPYGVKHKTGEVPTDPFGFNKKNTYAIETRYRRSFLFGICEGPATIVRAWIGDDEIPLTDFIQYTGAGHNDLTTKTGEDAGDYPHLLCAWFDEYDIGNSEAIPNFVFEVSCVVGTKYALFSEDGQIVGVPLGNGSLLNTLDDGGSARDEGGGIVSLPFSGNPFNAGHVIQISGTTNYNGTYTLQAGTDYQRIYIVDAYNAETFDGSETVILWFAGLNTAMARSVMDDSGNIYFAGAWDAVNETYITKVEPDGIISYDAVDNTEWKTWPLAGAYQVRGVAIHDNCLYVLVPGTLCPNPMLKFDLSDGSELWKNAQTGGAFGVCTDDDGNAYSARVKYDADNGTVSWMTNLGELKAGVTGTNFSYMTIFDSDLGVVINGGYQKETVSGTSDLIYNLAVRTPDDSVGDQVAVGDLVAIGGGCYETRTIGYGQIATNGNHIFVLISGATGRELYKYSWDGSSLTEVTHVTLAAPHACSIYFDVFGNLVVVNQDGGDTDVFWYYDTDLTYLSKIDGLPTLLSTWSMGVAGAAWVHGDVHPYPPLGSGVYDANPADIIEDMVTNKRYGAGDLAAYIDAESFQTCRLWWASQNELLSLVLKEAKPVVDWIDYILLHCNGYRYWSGGKLKLGVFKDDPAVFTLTQDDLVYEDGEPPIQITKRPYSDTWNRVEIAWTDRPNLYDAGIAVSQDEVDQRICGTVRKRTIDLMGITNATYAERQVHRMLIDSMYRFTIYNFKLGYKSMLCEVGDVGTISDGFQVVDQKVRIIGVDESKDGRVLKVTAVEDISRLYPTLSGYQTQENEREPDDDVTLSDTTISYREHLDEHLLYLSLAPETAYCNGWALYVSYDEGENYEFVANIVITGVTEGQCNSVGTLTTALKDVRSQTIVHRREESFNVNIGTVTDLKTNLTDELMFQGRSVCKIGDEIIGFASAVETDTPGVWTISQLIRGMFGSTPSAHDVGDSFATLDIDLGFEYRPDDIGLTLYFKALTFYGEEIQELSDVTATQITIQGYAERPAPATLIRLASDAMDGGFGNYSGGAFDLYWNLCNKPWNRSMGSDDTAWKYGDAESALMIEDGVLLENYSADDLLEAVDLLYQYPGGDMIGQEVLSVVSAATIDKTDDLADNDPARVMVLPRRRLRTWKKNYCLVDEV